MNFEKLESLKNILMSIIIGISIIVPLSWLSGSIFAKPHVPFLSILLGFIMAGLLIGWLYKTYTFVRTVFSFTTVALISYFVISSLNLLSFSNMNTNIYFINMLIIPY